MKLICLEIFEDLPNEYNVGGRFEFRPTLIEQILQRRSSRNCPRIVVFGENVAQAQCEAAMKLFAQSYQFWQATLIVHSTASFECAALIE
ncbi:MAG: hypothetical protein MUC48_09430 [Leptolyngbya sp. Prado105]|jgi:hypothetical protein|nr:hypothetical protein [Leptolyngbya sp. Prado105]